VGLDKDLLKTRIKELNKFSGDSLPVKLKDFYPFPGNVRRAK
jgi:hypothetical protein